MHIKMGRLLGSRTAYVNAIAAVPSLHFAVTSSLTLFFWSRTRRWRWVLVAYPVAMGLALVYLGEHYVFDLAVGMLYAIIAYVGAGRIVELWTARHPHRVTASS
jgi:membrane-associated phospholipid phosphatase